MVTKRKHTHGWTDCGPIYQLADGRVKADYQLCLVCGQTRDAKPGPAMPEDWPDLGPGETVINVF